jgi:hypothetical protein
MCWSMDARHAQISSFLASHVGTSLLNRFVTNWRVYVSVPRGLITTTGTSQLLQAEYYTCVSINTSVGRTSFFAATELSFAVV